MNTNCEDKEFCRLLDFDTEIEETIAIKIRALTAAKLGIPKHELTPEINTKILLQKSIIPWDNIDDILLPLEEEYGVELPNNIPCFTEQRFFFYKKNKGPENYGDWIKKTVQILKPYLV
jgi:hypothetical protein